VVHTSNQTERKKKRVLRRKHKTQLLYSFIFSWNTSVTCRRHLVEWHPLRHHHQGQSCSHGSATVPIPQQKKTRHHGVSQDSNLVTFPITQAGLVTAWTDKSTVLFQGQAIGVFNSHSACNCRQHLEFATTARFASVTLSVRGDNIIRMERGKANRPVLLHETHKYTVWAERLIFTLNLVAHVPKLQGHARHQHSRVIDITSLSLQLTAT
jgi:hypothetical protein